MKKNRCYDLYHANALWMECSHRTAAYARKYGKPYIISLHGGLMPQSFSKGTWKKKIMMYIWLNRDLSRAACVHVTSREELEAFRKFGFDTPVALIPNPVHFQKHTQYTKQDATFRLGYLGRLDSHKNIHLLLEAWCQTIAYENNVELFIIGSGKPDYQTQLEDYIRSHNLKNVKMAGFLNGDEKNAALSSLSALILPSKSENFGMVVPEALGLSVPVAASKGTPWSSLETERCGWWFDANLESICQTIQKIRQTSSQELADMGIRGKKFAMENFSTTVVSGKMEKLYHYVTGGGPVPDFIHLNQVK